MHKFDEKVMSSDETRASSRRTPCPQLGQWHLPPGFGEQLLAQHVPAIYEKGSVLFVRGSPSDIFFFLFEGVVCLYATQPDGTQSTFMLAGPGDFVGFANANDGSGAIHCLDARALTKCSVGLFTRRHLFQSLSNQSASVLLGLIEAMTAGWSRALLWQLNFLRLSFRDRIELVLRELGAKFGVTNDRGIMIDLNLRHSELSEMVGCSRQLVGKLLGQLASGGAIETAQDGRLILMEPLLTEAAECCTV